MQSGRGRCLSDSTRGASSSTSAVRPLLLTDGSSLQLIVSRWAVRAVTNNQSLQDIRPSNLLVRIGEYHVLNTNEPDKHVDRRIKKVVTHRSFDKITYEYDIALLEMHDGPVKYQVCAIVCEPRITPCFQPNIIPICLPDNDNSLVGQVRYLTQQYVNYQVGTVTGWGRLSEFGQISPVLREVKLPIISNSKCMQMYRWEENSKSDPCLPQELRPERVDSKHLRVCRHYRRRPGQL